MFARTQSCAGKPQPLCYHTKGILKLCYKIPLHSSRLFPRRVQTLGDAVIGHSVDGLWLDLVIAVLFSSLNGYVVLRLLVA